MACYDDTIVDRFLEPRNRHDVDGALALPDINYQSVRNSFARTNVVVELLVTATLGDGSKARFHACDILTLQRGLIAAKRSYRESGGVNQVIWFSQNLREGNENSGHS
jgi:hypothetical protein